MELLNEHRCFDGMQRRYRHASSSTNTPMTFSIYLPDTNENKTSLPVLYWLSGLTCTDENFIQKAGAQRIASQLGLVLVAPDTSPRGENVADDEGYDLGLGAGFYVNAAELPWSTHYQMYDYIVKELPLLIEQHFPVTHQRAISGHSMGGHGALMIGLKNPDRYTSISAFSPIVNPMNCPWGQKAFTSYLGEDQTLWSDYDSTELLKRSDANKRLPILISQGDQDDFLEKELKPEHFNHVSKEIGYPLEYHLQKGFDHSYFFVETFIEAHLNFHYDALKRPR